ncbi:MAG: lipid A biosynthesis acyltransferase, partial [Oceanobacter sp.]
MPPRQLLMPRYWPTWAGIGFLYLVTRLPFGWQLAVGRWIGLAFYAVGRSRRHIAATNIRLCFPEKSEAERKALVKDIFISTSIGLIETLTSWFRPPEYLLDR